MERGAFRVEDVPDPVPQAGEVLARPLACGICGSDLHAAQHTEEFVRTSIESGGAFKLTTLDPVVLGHEFCCEIVDYGPGCERKLPIGSHVCAVPGLPRGGTFVGVGYDPLAPGGFGELMLISERLMFEVPGGISPNIAALTEPMAVGYHAVAKAGIRGGETAVVIGAGPVGLAVTTALRHHDVRPIVVADYSPRRRELALALGADQAIDPRQASTFESIDGAATVPPVLFECVGVPGMLEQMMLGAPRDARIVVVGVCLQTDHYRPLIAINKELSVQYVLGYSAAEFRDTLRHIADGSMDVTPIVTGTTGLEGVAEAFDTLRNPEAHAKVLVKPDQMGGLETASLAP